MRILADITNRALAEACEAAKWYFDEREELGSRFETTVEEIVEEIIAHPLRFAEEEDGIRLAPRYGLPLCDLLSHTSRSSENYCRLPLISRSSGLAEPLNSLNLTPPHVVN